LKAPATEPGTPAAFAPSVLLFLIISSKYFKIEYLINL
jgi:hypothetical protein